MYIRERGKEGEGEKEVKKHRVVRAPGLRRLQAILRDLCRRFSPFSRGFFRRFCIKWVVLGVSYTFDVFMYA